MLGLFSSEVAATAGGNAALEVSEGEPHRGEESTQSEADRPEGPDSSDLSLDSIFFTLSNSRRRGVIYCLQRTDGPIEVGRLTTLVTAMETGTPPEEVTYAQRKRVYTSLRQSHLPKLDENGVVQFDQDAGTVEAAGGLSEIEEYLGATPKARRSWNDYCVGIGALSVTLYLLGSFAVAPSGLLPAIGSVGALALALATIAVARQQRTAGEAIDSDLDRSVLQEQQSVQSHAD